MHFVLLSPGKALTDPLFMLTAALIICLLIARRRLRSDSHGRPAVTLALALALALAVASTGWFETLLEDSLMIPSDRLDAATSFIIVPSGGRARASVHDQEILANDTMIRLVAGVRAWRKVPAATLILTGADLTSEGRSSATLLAMRDEAVRRGVPPGRIMIEGLSVNSRGHAVQLSQMIPRTTAVAIVSNGWHLRRLRSAFGARFDRASFVAADDAPRPPFTLNDAIPSAHGIRETTRMLHEWIGIAWYAFRP